MRILFYFAIAMFCSFASMADTPQLIVNSLNQDHQIQLPDSADCDSIIDIMGFKVRCVKANNKVSYIGLNLFNEDLKKLVDKDYLQFIEEALLAKALNINNDVYDRLVINNGSLDDFKLLSPQSDCRINTSNSKFMMIEWPVDDWTLSVTLPTNYDTVTSGSRSDIENNFIAKIKSFDGSRAQFEPIDTLKLEPYGDDKFIYPGDSYLNKQITRNIYFNSDTLTTIHDTMFPMESMANLFVYPSDFSDSIRVELTILKHEYGEKESVVIPLNRLLASCEDDGCTPYWGVEKFNDGILEGSLFLYNRSKSYDHVIKIKCSPDEILHSKGTIQGRVSLFIPTNNIHNLNAPYIPKTEKEKIKYEN